MACLLCLEPTGAGAGPGARDGNGIHGCGPLTARREALRVCGKTKAIRRATVLRRSAGHQVIERRQALLDMIVEALIGLWNAPRAGLVFVDAQRAHHGARFDRTLADRQAGWPGRSDATFRTLHARGSGWSLVALVSFRSRRTRITFRS